MLLVQYFEDASDRQMEDLMKDSLAVKLFCGFGLTEATPDHSFFGKFRKRVGTKKLSELFNRVVKSIRAAGFVGDTFSFVDASSLESRVNVWEARDKALADRDNNDLDDQGNRRLSNKNIGRYSSDRDARYGCKGKDKFWIGYKRHVCVDMKQGVVLKVAVTPANFPDGKGLRHVCPKQGMVIADKAYSEGEALKTILANGCHPGAIKKRNAKDKNREKDRFISRLRMPYEGVFAAQRKTARYRGLVKVQFQAFMEAIVFNIKRMITIGSPPLSLVA
jgi:IS5 family transposase